MSDRKVGRRTFNRTLAGAVASAALVPLGGCRQFSQIHGWRVEDAIPEPGCVHTGRTVSTYGGDYSVLVFNPQDHQFYPRNLDQFRAVSTGRANLRGGGFSFGKQSLIPTPSGKLIYTRDLELGDITVANDTVSAPGNADWGTVVERTLDQHQIPPVLVTGSGTTVGGTLSSNALSRHTPIWGKEVEAILDFDLLTWGGQLLEKVSRSNHPELFNAVIGGFGAFGLVTRVTHRLMALPSPVRVRTSVKKFTDLDAFCRYLKPAQVADPTAGTPTRYGLLFPTADKGFRGVTMDSSFVKSRMSNHYSAYLPWPACGVEDAKAGYYAMAANPKRVQELRNLGWNNTLELSYHDGVLPYTFFQDGHVMGKKRTLAKNCNPTIQTLQQTWIIPETTDPAQPKLKCFLEGIIELGLVERLSGTLDFKLGPTTFVDTFYVPADDVLLSASWKLPGFAVTVAYEGPLWTTVAAVGALRSLTKKCAKLGGRVHLTKHVFGDEQTIKAMYSDHVGGSDSPTRLEAFENLRQQYDPNGVWKNPQMRETFGWG